MQPAGQHSWWRSLYNRLSQSAEAEDVNEICIPQKSCRPHSYRHDSRADIQVHDMDYDIAHYPPEIMLDSFARRPSAMGQKDLGAIDPTPYNEVGDYVQLSNSQCNEPQTNFAANTHQDFHLPRPNLVAINVPTQYQIGSSRPSSPVRLQGHRSSKLPTTTQGDYTSFGSSIRLSNRHHETVATPHGYKNEAFLGSFHHSPSLYPSPATVTRIPAQPLASSTDPLPSHTRGLPSCTLGFIDEQSYEF